MKNILSVFKKELKRFLTDKRMLFTLIMPGFLIFIVYSLMGNFMGEMMNGGVSEDTQYTVYVDNQPTQFQVFDETEIYNITLNDGSGMTAEEKKESVKKGVTDLYIVYEADFYDKMLSYDIASGQQAPQVQIYYNSSSVTSQTIYAYYFSCLDALETQLANKFDVNAGAEIYDTASEADIMTEILGMILPMLLNVLLLTGCMAVATESMAGEKERGTIATLLVTPIKRSHLALGKVFALALVSLISATSSFLGLIFSLPSLIGVEFSAVPYGVGDYLAILAIIIINVLLFTVLFTVISTFAKSVKEAQGFVSPVMILVMVLSIASSLIPIEGLIGYCIPIFNTVLCLTSVVSMSFNIAGFFITLGVNVAVFALGVFLLSKMFNSEKIMFNK